MRKDATSSTKRSKAGITIENLRHAINLAICSAITL